MDNSLFSVVDRHVLITGATSGIGEHLAHLFKQSAAKVFVQGRNATRLEKVAASCHADKVLCEDLLNVNDWQAYVVEQEIQAVDIIINAAGVNFRQAWQDIRAADWDQTLDIHLKVPYFLSQSLVPFMMERNWGRIINFASLQSVRALGNSIPYGAAKGGVCQMTRAMAEAWSASGINCNAIAPGFFPTQLTAPVFNDPKLAQLRSQQTAIWSKWQIDRFRWCFTVLCQCRQ